MASDKIFTYPEYLKKYTSDHRAREYLNLFKIRGRRNDKTYIQFNLCQRCITNLYANKNRMLCSVNKEGKLHNIHINIGLCEWCIERNLFEVSSYVYKYSKHFKKTSVKVINDDDSVGEDSEKRKNMCTEEYSEHDKKTTLKPWNTKKKADSSESECKQNEAGVKKKRKRKNKPQTNISETEFIPTEVEQGGKKKRKTPCADIIVIEN